jgi:hypothetical protein
LELVKKLSPLLVPGIAVGAPNESQELSFSAPGASTGVFGRLLWAGDAGGVAGSGHRRSRPGGVSLRFR